MKKSLLFMLTAAMLIFSVAAANAPLTEAQYTNADTKQMTTSDGTLQFFEAEPILPSFEDEEIWTSNLDEDFDFQVDVTENKFDIVSIFSEARKTLYGFSLDLFFNPERVAPMLLGQNNVYNLYTGDYWYVYEELPSTIKHITDGSMLSTESSAIYNAYLTTGSDSYLTSYNASLDDGHTTALWVSSPIEPAKMGTKELMRWPFKLTDTSDNWYRTKITGNYSEIENGEAQIYPALDNVVYYYNENYTGPTFDILGAEMRNEGELRFKSVYFTGLNEEHDNRTRIVDAGLVLYPTALLDDKVLDINTEGAITIPTTGYLEKKSGNIIYSAVLTGLEGYEEMDITAKAYVTYKPAGSSEAVTVYSDPIARSLDWSDKTSSDIVVAPENGMLALLSQPGEASASVLDAWID